MKLITRASAILGTAFMLSLTSAVSLAATETPTSIKGATVVSPDTAKGMVGNAKFYDMRKALNYGKGHVPGAVLLSSKIASADTADADVSKDEIDLAKLPADKGAKIVFYGHGTDGWKAYKASLIAVKAGYKNVLWMRGGMSEWEGKGYPVEK